MQRCRLLSARGALMAALMILALPPAQATDQALDFRSKDFHDKVWPILKAKCLECHHAKDRQGALDLSSRAAMLKGGHSGAALVPGEPDSSLMIELIEFDEMPPRKAKTPRVSKAELDLLRRWIASGAAFPDKPGEPPGQ